MHSRSVGIDKTKLKEQCSYSSRSAPFCIRW